MTTTILMLDDEQSEMMTFGLAVALQAQRRALAEIMQERLQKAADGERNVSEWKMTRFNSLLYRVFPAAGAHRNGRYRLPGKWRDRSRLSESKKRRNRPMEKATMADVAAARGGSAPPLR